MTTPARHGVNEHNHKRIGEAEQVLLQLEWTKESISLLCSVFQEKHTDHQHSNGQIPISCGMCRTRSKQYIDEPNIFWFWPQGAASGLIQQFENWFCRAEDTSAQTTAAIWTFVKWRTRCVDYKLVSTVQHVLPWSVYTGGDILRHQHHFNCHSAVFSGRNDKSLLFGSYQRYFLDNGDSKMV